MNGLSAPICEVTRVQYIRLFACDKWGKLKSVYFCICYECPFIFDW